MATILDTTDSTELAYRYLVSDEDWGCLVRHLMAKASISRHEAEATMNEALGFLVTSSRFPGELLAPSAQVDMAWDLLVTHTRTYDSVCRQLGRFIHHDPMDGVGFVSDARGAEVVAHTVSLMRTVGPVNAALWSSGNGTGSGGSGDGGDGQGWKCCVG